MINWVKILYTDFTVQIQTEGHLSKKIPIERSVHQGGCASAFLFILLIETLAISIREDQNIRGIIVKNSEHKINQFADDTSILSDFDQNNLDNIIEKLNWFQQQSGLKISYDKTFLYRIGSLRDTDAELYTQNNIAWEGDGLKILGIYVTHKEDILNKNYDPVLQKVQTALSNWKNRDMSLFGKITIVNTLVASLFIHTMTALPNMTDEIISRVDRYISDFIWNRAKPKFPSEPSNSQKS